MKNRYRDVFFDLDHTLWDFEKSSSETLKELYTKYEIEKFGKNVTLNTFQEVFREVNFNLWNQYNNGEVNKQKLREIRFKNVLTRLKLDSYEKLDHIAIGNEYLAICPRKPYLIDHCLEILTYLSSRYKLHIITNGFDEVQDTKLKSSNIYRFFDKIITSESTGYKKPRKEIFEYALKVANTNCESSLMIGDNLETDIKGAMRASLDCVFYNPLRVKHGFTAIKEIYRLSELQFFL